MNITRRGFNKSTLAVLASLSSAFNTAQAESLLPQQPIPVILDTDIGDDIDDTWALMMLLRTQAVDVKLITTDFGNTRYRTRLLAKLLHNMGQGHIPIGVGLDATDHPGNQSEWLGEYQLEDYPGTVHEDGVDALINVIKRSPVPVTLLCIGPVMNIAEALRRDPSIAKNARFVGMHGSIRIGYEGQSEPSAEWNVRVDPKSLQQVFAAPWECTIAPLDSCGQVTLSGQRYQDILENDDAWTKILRANYRIWLPKATWLNPRPEFESASSVLFDTVAVHLAHSESYLIMEDLPLRVTDDGFTVIDEQDGRLVRCATGWQDQEGFEARLVETITQATIPASKG